MQMSAFWMILIALFGWCAGLVVNYLADLLPNPARHGHARCPSCGQRLPLSAYLPWPRRCPTCARRPGLREWLTPGLGALGALYCWFNPLPEWGAFLSFLVLAYFGLVTIIDIEHRLILFSTSAFGAFLGLLAGWLHLGWKSTLLGGLAGLGLLFAIYLLGILFGHILARLRGQALNETVFGFGDVLLGGVIGLLVGWPAIIQSLLITVLSAGLFSLVYLFLMLALRRYRLGIALPYGPFLIIGGMISL